VKEVYLSLVVQLERMHRQFLEVLKLEIERIEQHDINNVQALILYNIGHDELTVGELTLRGYYLGSNVSYNLRKMTAAGFLQQHRSENDRRTVRVSLTEKGARLREQLATAFDRHIDEMTDTVAFDELMRSRENLRKLERFWLGQLGFGTRLTDVAALTSAA